jgi:hypothetical protein
MQFFKLVAGGASGLLVLGLSMVTGASAGTVSGAYDYAYTNTTASASCSAYDGARDNFASTSGGNSIDASDTVNFSICDGVTGLLVGGEFSIVDGDGTLAGTFSGELVGAAGSGPGGGDSFDGTYTVTTDTGLYAGVPAVGDIEVVTGNVNVESEYLTGSIDFQSTPEPMTMVLTGSGFLLLGLSRKFLKRRP